jgi:hypothetical protein
MGHDRITVLGNEHLEQAVSWTPNKLWQPGNSIARSIPHGRLLENQIALIAYA